MALSLPPHVAPVITTFLETVDAEQPTLIEGLYLTGSVALGDFRPRASDIDFVAVTATRPDGISLAALQRAHRILQVRYSGTVFEGVYLTWDDLTGDPSAISTAPAAFGGRFHPTARFALNPVTWHTLAKHGVVCRGPAVTSLDVWA
ncbi:MAG TPA: nucleotidyltransferase domain-containing protein, partial [Chloroflexota bacterium]|nr:nucleotidyltransferase domain-containing protein [Chloroflexota bacterium]